MKKRYVLDGPPGSGKSTLLFGGSDGVKQGKAPYTLEGLGYACIHESVAEAHEIMARKQVEFTRQKELWLQTVVELDRDKYSAVHDGVTFFDRCFHHWQLLSDMSGIGLPAWFSETNASIRYDNPIFLIAPVASFDLTASGIHESRRFSWQQRLDMYGQARGLYQSLGYKVVEIPVFYEGDIDHNNRARIARILEHVE